MQPDPDAGMDPPMDLGDPGTPAPTDAGSVQAENERLKQENARLREERRSDRAKALGAQHGLTPTQVELLQLVPADQMEDKAKALESERGTTAVAPAEIVEPVEPVVDPALASFEEVPGGDAPAAPLSFQGEIRERINKAESLEEIEAIQREMRDRQRAERTAQP